MIPLQNDRPSSFTCRFYTLTGPPETPFGPETSGGANASWNLSHGDRSERSGRPFIGDGGTDLPVCAVARGTARIAGDTTGLATRFLAREAGARIGPAAYFFTRSVDAITRLT
jgi:hypothetical protein